MLNNVLIDPMLATSNGTSNAPIYRHPWRQFANISLQHTMSHYIPPRSNAFLDMPLYATTYPCTPLDIPNYTIPSCIIMCPTCVTVPFTLYVYSMRCEAVPLQNVVQHTTTEPHASSCPSLDHCFYTPLDAIA